MRETAIDDLASTQGSSAACCALRVRGACDAVSFAGVAHAPPKKSGMEPANMRVDDIASLQRGSRLFFNYCSGCHSLQYLRYSRIAEDLKLDEKEVPAT